MILEGVVILSSFAAAVFLAIEEEKNTYSYYELVNAVLVVVLAVFVLRRNKLDEKKWVPLIGGTLILTMAVISGYRHYFDGTIDSQYPLTMVAGIVVLLVWFILSWYDEEQSMVRDQVGIMLPAVQAIKEASLEQKRTKMKIEKAGSVDQIKDEVTGYKNEMDALAKRTRNALPEDMARITESGGPEAVTEATRNIDENHGRLSEFYKNVERYEDIDDAVEEFLVHDREKPIPVADPTHPKPKKPKMKRMKGADAFNVGQRAESTIDQVTENTVKKITLATISSLESLKKEMNKDEQEELKTAKLPRKPLNEAEYRWISTTITRANSAPDKDKWINEYFPRGRMALAQVEANGFDPRNGKQVKMWRKLMRNN